MAIRTDRLQSLPEEKLIAIQASLPMKSLLRFRCACKSFCSTIIGTPFYFISSYSNGARLLTVHYICSVSDSDSDSDSDCFKFSSDSSKEADCDRNSDPDSDNISDPVSDEDAGGNKQSDTYSDSGPYHNYDADYDSNSDPDSGNISDPVSDEDAGGNKQLNAYSDSCPDFNYDADSDTDSDPDSDNISDPESDAEVNFHFTQIHTNGFALQYPATAQFRRQILKPYFRFPITHHISGFALTKEYMKTFRVPTFLGGHRDLAAAAAAIALYNTSLSTESWRQIENPDVLARVPHTICNFINEDFDIFNMSRELRNNYIRLPHSINNVSSINGWVMKQKEGYWNNKHCFTRPHDYNNSNTSMVKIRYPLGFWKKEEEVFVETAKNKLVFKCKESLVLQSNECKWRTGIRPFGISLMHQMKIHCGKWRIR